MTSRVPTGEPSKQAGTLNAGHFLSVDQKHNVQRQNIKMLCPMYTVRQFHFWASCTNFCISWSRTSVDNEGLHRWANRVTNSIARLKQCAFYANDVFIVNITLCVGNQVHMCLFERREDSNWCTKIVIQLLDEKPKLVVAISALSCSSAACSSAESLHPGAKHRKLTVYHDLGMACVSRSRHKRSCREMSMFIF